MAKRRARVLKASDGQPAADGISFAEVLSLANRRAHEQANRRSGRREIKSVRAAIAATAIEDDAGSVEWTPAHAALAGGVVLLPLCWVTTWTFLSRFSDVTLEKGFWQTPEFWYSRRVHC